MTSLSVVTQMKDFPILIIIGVALIAGILGIIIKYANKENYHTLRELREKGR